MNNWDDIQNIVMVYAFIVSMILVTEAFAIIGKWLFYVFLSIR